MANFIKVGPDIEKGDGSQSRRVYGAVVVNPHTGEVRKIWEDGKVELVKKGGNFVQ